MASGGVNKIKPRQKPFYIIHEPPPSARERRSGGGARWTQLGLRSGRPALCSRSDERNTRLGKQGKGGWAKGVCVCLCVWETAAHLLRPGCTGFDKGAPQRLSPSRVDPFEKTTLRIGPFRCHSFRMGSIPSERKTLGIERGLHQVP